MRAPTPTTSCADGRTGSPNGTSEGRHVLVYFNNDLGGHAIRNARKLKDLLA